MTQALLDYLPGYMFDGQRVVSTGVALPPTQFVNKRTGEVMYYVRPLFRDGASIGLFIRHEGVLNSLRQTKSED